MLTRRHLLLGTGVLALGGAAAVPGLRDHAALLVHPVPVPPHPVPTGPVGPLLSGSFASKAMGRVVGWSLAYPVGSAPGAALPVLLELHGRGADHAESFSTHHLDRFLSAAVRAGLPPFAIASVDGGEHSYWHRRPAGDPQTMLLDEFLPLLRSRGLRVDRLALGGWSMGGYGALLLAERLGRSRVAAVAVDSPALWTQWKDSAPGAFDGPQDFAAHDVLASVRALAGIPVRVSCGTSDPFIGGVRAFLDRVPTAGHDLGPGGHTVQWWLHAAPGQMAFVGHALAG
ncbi:MAG: putative esterase [Frankiales bacterium]|nr:putative esterase [Frankiales bacterium]